MNIVRLNRMMLGVSEPVAAFCERVFGAALRDVDDAIDSVGCDVLVVGRQQLRDTGVYSFAHDVIPRCLALHKPPLLVPVIADRFDAHRYARDLEAWTSAQRLGVGVVVFELGVLRERRAAAGGDEQLAALARSVNEQAKTSTTPLTWLSGVALS